jgi:hypothetical protein
MSSDDAASGQDHLPLDDVTDPSAELSADPDTVALDADLWGADIPDISGANLFTDEIENVDVSDWDIDASLIWGDDGEHPVVEDGGDAIGLDFPL